MGFPHRLVTLDLMAFDLETPTLSEITQTGIVAISTPIEVMLEMSQLAMKHKISTFDGALLLYSKSTSSILLSGDKALRNAARIEGVSIKGTLWVLEEVVKKGILQSSQAVLILERMFLLGRRLPPDEATSKILKWENDS